MVADIYQGKEVAKIGSIIGALMPIVIAIAPAIGGLIQEYFGWREVFFFFLIFTIFVLFLVQFHLKETNKNLKKKSIKNILIDYLSLLSNKLFFLYLIIPCITLAGVIGYLTISPYIFQEVLGLSPKENGFISIITSAAAIIGAMINAKLLNRFPSEKLLLMSAIFMVISSLSLFYFANDLTIMNFLISGIFYFISINFAFSNSFALIFQHARKNKNAGLGTASALISGSQHFVAMIASLMISILPNDNVLPICYMFLCCGITILLVVILTHKYSSNEMD